ncbi:uncharacterized protein BCR38DRAFT_422555 [Pseudomassariella vexata]|uniref:Uncharacterized protein n=1 Tax=Pseudomassariella vexata TaxID=1141098 RepID=A0A1Y2E9N1_9PEZI|nr:uncharacterized protein BCR38DRAFT_422555 [Pseudomassariella vexata]ORY68252.1 hypothetical protein BCR38DRAFT_422555 [Pseudomassariella vexata]
MKFTLPFAVAALLSSLANAAPFPDTEIGKILPSRETTSDLDKRVETSVQTPNGLWTATVYKSFINDYDEGDTAVQVGANIRLSFLADSSRKVSNNIKLIQFTYPLTPHNWHVDRGSGAVDPYHAWADASADAPNTVIDVGGMGDLQKYVGKPAAGKGNSLGRNGNTEAFLIDTPRELIPIPEPGIPGNAVYTTFAYDIQNSEWLGGVSWGYTASNQGGVGPLTINVFLSDLKLRVKGAPNSADEELEAIKKWNADTSHAPVPATS